MAQQDNKPIKEFRIGAISASVWRNEQQQQDGDIRVRYSVTIQKRFRNKDGEWQDTNCYFPEDLPRLRLVAAKAFEFISLRESQYDEPQEAVPI